jgi:sugar-specific transcriptional regulator TrmB
VLRVIGLSLAEEELYERLVRGPAATLVDLAGTAPGGDADLAAATDHTAATAASLDRLRELGLVTRLAGEPARWSATPPGDTLDALLRDRDRALAEVSRRVAELDARFGQAARTGSPAPVEVIYGRDAVVERSEEIQRRARYEVRCCDAPPYAGYHPAEVNAIEIDHLRRGVRYRVIYDRRSLDVPGRLADLEAGIAAGEQARVTEVPVKMTFIDDVVAILPLRNPVDVESRMFIRDPVLLHALSTLFEMYWERALPLRVTNGRAQVAGDVSGPLPDEAHLLPLLVAGLTDREIGAQLQVSDRTVRARVRAMTARLDAATRFQAGYQAVSRGWLAADDDEKSVAVFDAGE